MLSTQDLGVDIAIVLSGDGAGIGRSGILTRWLLLRLMYFTESVLNIKYRAGKAASMVLVVVTAIVVVVAVVGANKSACCRRDNSRMGACLQSA
jgi:hypothetical protein